MYRKLHTALLNGTNCKVLFCCLCLWFANFGTDSVFASTNTFVQQQKQRKKRQKVVHDPYKPNSQGVIVADIQFCTDSLLNSTLNELRKLTNDDLRLQKAKIFVSEENLTIEQIMAVAKTFLYDSTREEFLEYAYFFSFEQDRFYKVYGVLEFYFSKQKLKTYIKRVNLGYY